MKVLLNKNKIDAELTRLEWSKARLAKEMGITKQLLNYHYHSKSILMVDKFAGALHLDARDLIVFDSDIAA